MMTGYEEDLGLLHKVDSLVDGPQQLRFHLVQLLVLIL